MKSKIAIVTGAASGIGKATADLLANSGYRVYGTSRRDTPGMDSALKMLTCDVTDDTSVRRMVEQVETAEGRVDLLVNNAGVGMFGGADESSIAQSQSLFDVNVFGVMRVINAVLPVMHRQGSGRIINISSVQGFIPAPYFSHYGATKHAIEGYSQSLDHELRTFGIRVLLVEPAFTRTAFEDNLIKADRPIELHGSARAAVSEAFEKAIQDGDPPEVVAKAVLKAAESANPKLRYPAGKAARQVSLLRRFVPSNAFDKSLRKMFRLVN